MDMIFLAHSQSTQLISQNYNRILHHGQSIELRQGQQIWAPKCLLWDQWINKQITSENIGDKHQTEAHEAKLHGEATSLKR